MDNSFLTFQINKTKYSIATEYVVQIYGDTRGIQQTELLQDISVVSVNSENKGILKRKILILLECDNNKFGIYADQVDEVVNLKLNVFYELPDIMKSSESNFIEGVLVVQEKNQLQYVLNAEELQAGNVEKKSKAAMGRRTHKRNLTDNYMVFHSGDYSFGVPGYCVQEILAEFTIEKIPWNSSWAYGILYYKGRIIPTVYEGNGTQQIAVICQYGTEPVAFLASDVGNTIAVTEDDVLEEKSDSNIIPRIRGDIYLYSESLWDEPGK